MIPMPRQRTLVSAIIPTGLVAGVMDGSAAVITHDTCGGHNPERIFQYIASALLSADALTGGAGIVELGVLLHMGIATGWTVEFFLAASERGHSRQNRQKRQTPATQRAPAFAFP